MKFVWTIVIVVFLSWCTEEIYSLDCMCDDSPCEEPTCCETKQLVTGGGCSCGCKYCAKGLNEKCQGLWNDNGFCATGLSCYTSCTCVTENENICIFPFKYKGKTYYTCTTTDSNYGKPWCALQVNRLGNVVRWGYCKDCRRSSFDSKKPCYPELTNEEHGICVQESVRNQIENMNKNDTVTPFFKFDAISQPKERVPQCSFHTKNQCKCARLAENVAGTCIYLHQSRRQYPNKLEINDFKLRPSNHGGYCFLENVMDPLNPKKNCFNDVKWSKTHGRYWSRDACNLIYRL